MDRARLRAALRWAFILSILLVALCAAVLFLMPRIVDLPAVRKEIHTRLSQEMRGQVAWDSLEVRLFPAPYAVLRNCRVTLPGRVAVRAERIDLGLALFPLLRARTEVRSVTLFAPVAELWLSSTAENASPGKGNPDLPDPTALYRDAMQPVVDVLRRIAPDMLLVVQDGRFDVHAADAPIVGAKGIAMRVQMGPSGMTASLDAEGNQWQRVQIDAAVQFSDLRTRMTVNAVGVKPQTWLDRYLSGAQNRIELPAVTLHAEANTDARNSMSLELLIEAPSTSVRRGDRRLDIPRIRVNSFIEVGAQFTEFTLRDVQLGELFSGARASFRYTRPDGRWRAAMEFPDLELSGLRAAALSLAADHPFVRDYVANIKGGHISGLKLSAEAGAISELFRAETIRAQLKLINTSFHLLPIRQDLRSFNAEVLIENHALKLSGAAAQIGGSVFRDGTFDLDLYDGRFHAASGFDIELSEALGMTRRLVPAQQRKALAGIESLTGRAQGSARIVRSGKEWQLQLGIARSTSLVRLQALPWPLRLAQGKITASPRGVRLANLSGSLSASRFEQIGVDMSLGRSPRILAARGSAKLELDQIYPWLRARERFAQALAAVSQLTGSAEVTIHHLSGPIAEPSLIAYDVSVVPRNVGLRIADVPGGLAFSGGSLRISPTTLQLERFGAVLFDAAANVSGSIKGYRHKDVRFEGAVADAAVGPQFIDWIWQRAKLPERLLPATPIRFAAQRVHWSRSAGVRLTAAAHPEGGPDVGIELDWQGAQLSIKRLSIKDAQSDATVAAAVTGSALNGHFSGELASRSVSALLKRASGEYPGRVSGDFRFKLDRKHPDRFSASGRLSGQAVDLGWILPVPLTLEHFDLEADAGTVRMREVSVDWAGQKATLRGEVAGSATGLVVDAHVDAEDVAVDALLPARSEMRAATTATDSEPPPRRFWPLPVTGKLTLAAKSLKWHRYTVLPIHAVLTMERERVHVDVADAALCGIAFPFVLDATPQSMEFTVRLSSKDQQLEDTARCLSDQHVLITGRFDLSADLSSKGNAGEFLQNLSGPVRFDSREGQIKKFAMLGNILALKDLSGLVKKGVRAGSEGFDYRSLTFRGQFGDGLVRIEQAALDSSALGLAASGSVRLSDRHADVTVLVAPFGRLDRAVRKLPILGYVLGGAITSLPVGVSGDITNPVVTPLGAKAVTAEVLGIFERTFQIPGKILEPLDNGQSVP